MLVLVVGPSGAGKDTLLNAARAELEDDPGVRFVRRVITRPPARPDAQDPEAFDGVSEKEFVRLRDAGGFALWWRAHGLLYGVPADVSLDLAQGRTVVANASRAVVAEAVARFPVRLVEVTAPADLLARRLVARGREDAVDVARRLSRAVELPSPVERETVVNDGTVEQGARKLLAAFNRAKGAAPRP